MPQVVYERRRGEPLIARAHAAKTGARDVACDLGVEESAEWATEGDGRCDCVRVGCASPAARLWRAEEELQHRHRGRELPLRQGTTRDIGRRGVRKRVRITRVCVRACTCENTEWRKKGGRGSACV
eukprot:3041570-Pleurochrysis_carterae.AAC.1